MNRREESNWNKLFHYSIRKTTLGVGSVVVGVFLFGANPLVAMADTTEAATPEVTAQPEVTSKETQPEVSEVGESQASSEEVATSTEESTTPVAEAENSTQPATEDISEEIIEETPATPVEELPTTPATETKVDVPDDASEVIYNGKWFRTNQKNKWSNFSRNEDKSDISATLFFNGTGIEVTGQLAPNHGIYTVELDGQTLPFQDGFGHSTTVNGVKYFSGQAAERTADQKLITLTALQEGIHSLTVRLDSEKNDNAQNFGIQIDQFAILGSQPQILSKTTVVNAYQGAYNALKDYASLATNPEAYQEKLDALTLELEKAIPNLTKIQEIQLELIALIGEAGTEDSDSPQDAESGSENDNTSDTSANSDTTDSTDTTDDTASNDTANTDTSDASEATDNASTGESTDITNEGNSQSTTGVSTSPKEWHKFNHFTKTDQNVNFDNDWKFHLGEVAGASGKEFDDSSWSTLNLPHDFSLTQDYTTNGEAESGYKPGGTGWYRKSFSINDEVAKGRVSIQFDGSYMETEVFINGTSLGVHPYGYNAFSFDLTPHLKVNEENTLAVKVVNKVPSSRFYSGSGIYRSVHLNLEPKVHLAEYGVSVKTPDLATTHNQATGSTINISAQVINGDSNTANVQIKTILFERNADGSLGREVHATDLSDSLAILANQTGTVNSTFKLVNPKLWSVENPNLYVLRTEVYKDGQKIQTNQQEVGFRFVSFDANTGFKLNGQAMKLKGVSMHHDQGSLGASAYYDAVERQFELLKDMGVNTVRVTHNPSARVMKDIANRKGMMLIDEAFDTWIHAKNGNTYDYARWFDQQLGETAQHLNGAKGTEQTWAEYHIKQMVKSGLNDPSIIMWSTGNEVLEGHNGNSSRYPEIITNLMKWVDEVDGTRPSTLGDNKLKNKHQTSISMANALTNKTQGPKGIVGYNYASGSQYDEGHTTHPDWIIYGSETASAVNSRGIYNVKGNEQRTDKQLTAYDQSTVPWGKVASDAWYDVITRDFVLGEFIWTGFDYLGEPTPWNNTTSGAKFSDPLPKSSYFGIIDTAGLPKDSYYFYRSQWNTKDTTLHVLPAWKESVVKKDNQNNVEVVVYSNAAEVELQFINKQGETRSLGRKKFTKETTQAGYTYQVYKGDDKSNTAHRNLYLTFTVPYEDGTLKAIAYDVNGQLINDTVGNKEVTTFGVAHKLVTTVTKKSEQATDHSLAYVEVEVQDEQGNFVADANNLISIAVEGPAELVAMDNGDATDHQSYQDNNRKAFSGKVIAILRMTGKTGTVKVTASSVGLNASSASFAVTGQENTGDRKIDSYYLSKTMYIKKGTPLSLPDKVTVRYTDGTEEEKTLSFDQEAIAQGLEAGTTFVAKGRIENLDTNAEIVVSVIDQVAAIKNISFASEVGQKPQLPAQVQAYLADGTLLSAQFPVTWNTPEDTRFNTEGLVTIEGVADVLGDKLPVKATIRVARKTTQIDQNVAPAVVQLTEDTTGTTSDNLQAIKDGSLTVSANPKGGPNQTIWSNYGSAQRGDKDSTLSFRYDTAQNIAQVVVYYHQDSASLRLPKATTFSWSTGPGANAENVSATIVNRETVGGLTKITYQLENITPAVIFNVHIENSNETLANNRKPSTGIAELQLMTAIETFTQNSDANINSLRIGNYTVPTNQISQNMSIKAELGDIVASNTDKNVAVTILPIKNNQFRLFTESEDKTRRMVYDLTLVTESPATDTDSRYLSRNSVNLTAGSTEQRNGNQVANAKDFNLNTIWHSAWAGTAKENLWIQLDAGSVQKVNGLAYMGRQDTSNNGKVTDYEILVSSDNATWRKVKEGRFDDVKSWQEVTFEGVDARYVRLKAIHTMGDSSSQADRFMSASEVRLRVESDGTTPPPADPQTPETTNPEALKAQRINLSIGATATASDTERDFWGADKAIDGIVNRGATPNTTQSRWSTNRGETPRVLTVDLGAQKTIDSFVINWERTNIKGFHIEYSTDGSAYQTAYRKTDDTYNELDTTINLTTPITAQFVKLTVDRFDGGTSNWPSVSIYEFQIIGTQTIEDLAHKKVATSNGNEAASFNADKAVDGDSTTRWASSKGQGTKSIQVDLGAAKEVASVVLNWERQNASQYKIQVSQDGQDWTTVKTLTRKPSELKEIINLDTPQEARHVKVLVEAFDSRAQDRSGQMVDWPTVSLFDFEVYGQPIVTKAVKSLRDIANELVLPELAKGMTSWTLPTVPADVDISFIGADFEQIIDYDLTVYQPLVDTTVQVNYKLTRGDETYETPAYSIVVKGQYEVTAEDNAVLPVVPGIAEWKGHTGHFTVNASTRIVVNPKDKEALSYAVQSFKEDYEAITGKSITIVYDTTPTAGDFYFELNETHPGLKEEGYLMTIDDVVKVEASHKTGAFWSTQTLLQVLKQDPDQIAKGIARDYPKYARRGFVLDVGRKPVQLSTLKDMIKSLSWYKYNDFQLHLNDNYIWVEEYQNTDNPYGAYSAFRLESDIKEGGNNGLNKADLTAKDLFYTKEEFRDLILFAKNRGIQIVPEFDAPAHALAFTKVRPDLTMTDKSVRRWVDHLEVSNPEALEFIKSVWNEYLDGEDPVFGSTNVIHMGVDEFEGNNEAFRAFTDSLLKYAISKGKTPRFWGSLTAKPGTTPVQVDGVEMNIWSVGWARPADMYHKGYKLINTLDSSLYWVPGANYYQNLLNSEALYNNWEANKMGNTVIPAGSKQMLGAAFAIWNDLIGNRANGVQDYDVYKGFEQSLPALAAKMWGNRAVGNYRDLTARVEAIGKPAKQNPYKEVASESSVISRYRFDLSNLEDLSGNNNDGVTAKNVDYEAGKNKTAVRFNGGESYIETPITSVGPNNSFSVWVKLDADADGEQILAENGHTALKLVQKETGKVGFSAENYDYSFNYTLPKDEWVQLTFRGYEGRTELYVNNNLVDTLSQSQTGRRSATLVLPTQFIGSKTKALKGMLDDLVINQYQSEEGYLDRAGWQVASDNENADGTADKAFDGDLSTIWHTKWSPSKQELPASITIDMTAPHHVDKLVYVPRKGVKNGNITGYKLYGKLAEADEYHLLKEGALSDDASTKTIAFATEELRYLKLDVISGFGGFGSAAEIMVAQSDIKKPLRELALEGKAHQELASHYTADSVKGLVQALDNAKAIIAKADSNQAAVSQAMTSLQAAIDALEISQEERVSKVPDTAPTAEDKPSITFTNGSSVVNDIPELAFSTEKRELKDDASGVLVQLEVGEIAAIEGISVGHKETKDPNTPNVLKDRDYDLFDISLVDAKGQAISPLKDTLVIMPVDDGKTVGKVVYLPNTDQEEELDFTMTSFEDSDGVTRQGVVFVAKHFSEYGIVYKTVQKPETAVPNTAPTAEDKPVFEGTLETQVPKTAPSYELPEGKIETAVPNTAPSHELLAFDGKLAPMSKGDKQAEKKAVQASSTTQAKVLPNTGDNSNSVVVGTMLALSSLALYGYGRKRRDSEL
ncbi:discoidin domain-containing protein [Streptococcus sp. CSL10205-OR2]|uniref:discoidin domain-containing protein n=1 Tax=Streptococcus sp. CSL10205-OR2 TaxID=2980558 RepID=UPI0021D94E76|nr:discoidin domain-containing protein [Streptococcus sp. CSL10205-OR2]MCU9533046.1 discoidin domain-containing protein [Streptococcus sp. CSL10205-OR2]